MRPDPGHCRPSACAAACVPLPGYYYGNWPVAPTSDRIVAGSFGVCCDACTVRAACVAFTYWPVVGAGAADCTIFTSVENDKLFANADAVSFRSARLRQSCRSHLLVQLSPQIPGAACADPLPLPWVPQMSRALRLLSLRPLHLPRDPLRRRPRCRRRRNQARISW